MYRTFDLTGKQEAYKDVVDLTLGVKPGEPSKFAGGRYGAKAQIKSCSPEEDEKLIIVLLPKICTKHILKGCYEVHSLTIWSPDGDMCVMFVLKLEKDGAFAAFNQADSVFKTKLHCFTWDGKEQVFGSEDELSLKILGYVDTSD